MSSPAEIAPDTKDWTWVLERACEECGFDAGAVDRVDLGAMIRDNAAAWQRVLAAPEATQRPEPTVWSPTEYAAHVRDVHRMFAGRVGLMLSRGRPDLRQLGPGRDRARRALRPAGPGAGGAGPAGGGRRGRGVVRRRGGGRLGRVAARAATAASSRSTRSAATTCTTSCTTCGTCAGSRPGRWGEAHRVLGTARPPPRAGLLAHLGRPAGDRRARPPDGHRGAPAQVSRRSRSGPRSGRPSSCRRASDDRRDPRAGRASRRDRPAPAPDGPGARAHPGGRRARHHDRHRHRLAARQGPVGLRGALGPGPDRAGARRGGHLVPARGRDGAPRPADRADDRLPPRRGGRRARRARRCRGLDAAAARRRRAARRWDVGQQRGQVRRHRPRRRHQPGAVVVGGRLGDHDRRRARAQPDRAGRRLRRRGEHPGADRAVRDRRLRHARRGAGRVRAAAPRPALRRPRARRPGQRRPRRRGLLGLARVAARCASGR